MAVLKARNHQNKPLMGSLQRTVRRTHGGVGPRRLSKGLGKTRFRGRCSLTVCARLSLCALDPLATRGPSGD